MGWVLLILGVALWWGAHLLKRVAPAQRAVLGTKGKGAVALLVLVSVVLMVLGFRGTPFLPLWEPPSFLRHVNNLLMLVAFYFMSPAPSKGALFSRMRHPMLTGFGLWAVAHLLVNGDLAAILLFGGLLVWSLVAQVAINRAEPDWAAPEKGTLSWDLRGLVGAIVLVGVVGMIHGWLGPFPFGG